VTQPSTCKKMPDAPNFGSTVAKPVDKTVAETTLVEQAVKEKPAETSKADHRMTKLKVQDGELIDLLL